jgi:hypothetical protein
MRLQTAFLEQELVEVQRQFNIVKELGLESSLSELRKLKKTHKKLREACGEAFEAFKSENEELVGKIVGKLLRSGEMDDGERVMAKLNQLDNELDYFIEN